MQDRRPEKTRVAFTVRIPADLKRSLHLRAVDLDLTIQSVVEAALEHYLSEHLRYE